MQKSKVDWRTANQNLVLLHLNRSRCVSLFLFGSPINAAQLFPHFSVALSLRTFALDNADPTECSALLSAGTRSCLSGQFAIRADLFLLVPFFASTCVHVCYIFVNGSDPSAINKNANTIKRPRTRVASARVHRRQ